MELDKRIIEGKRPLTCYDIEEAKEYIGKVCYVCDEYDFFSKLGLAEKTILKGVEDCEIPFHYDSYDSEKQAEFCIPAEWVKEPEKKYRPFSYKEFWRLFDVGDGVCFRRKGQDIAEFSMFLGYEIDSDGNRDEIPGEGKVNLGGNRYTLAELFEYYEMMLDDEWQPFGVVDEGE